MKKIFILFITFMLMLFIFSGCGEKEIILDTDDTDESSLTYEIPDIAFIYSSSYDDEYDVYLFDNQGNVYFTNAPMTDMELIEKYQSEDRQNVMTLYTTIELSELQQKYDMFIETISYDQVGVCTDNVPTPGVIYKEERWKGVYFHEDGRLVILSFWEEGAVSCWIPGCNMVELVNWMNDIIENGNI